MQKGKLGKKIRRKLGKKEKREIGKKKNLGTMEKGIWEIRKIREREQKRKIGKRGKKRKLKLGKRKISGKVNWDIEKWEIGKKKKENRRDKTLGKR